MLMKENVLFSIADHPTPKIDKGDTGFSLRNCDNKAPQCVVIENHPTDSRIKICEDGVFQTLSSRMGTGGNNVPMVMEDKATANTEQEYQRCFEEGAYQLYDCGNCPYRPKCKNWQDNKNNLGNAVVRRLTPLECTRLQGFPDGWVDIGEWTDSKGKKHKDSDSPKYKALGNSLALPYWQWLSYRIVDQLKADGVENPTMASLFSGIGGFELVFTRAGCTPVWNSEIEEFPEAVTKARFGDD